MMIISLRNKAKIRTKSIKNPNLFQGSDILRFGGAGRDRTGDLIVANDALSQLSYSPKGVVIIVKRGQIYNDKESFVFIIGIR